MGITQQGERTDNTVERAGGDDGLALGKTAAGSSPAAGGSVRAEAARWLSVVQELGKGLF